MQQTTSLPHSSDLTNSPQYSPNSTTQAPATTTPSLPSSSIAPRFNRGLPAPSVTSQEKIASAIAEFGSDYTEMVFCRYQKPVPIERAVATGAPTFRDVTDFFGERATAFWLRFHIAETFDFLGIFNTASKEQIRQTAELILSHEIFGQLTLSEFLCFLQRFKLGHYGKIYQSARPNPQELLACLEPFWNELCLERGREQERQRLQKLHEERQNRQPPSPEQLQHIREIQQRLRLKFPTKRLNDE